jgi:hypothetical protein
MHKTLCELCLKVLDYSDRIGASYHTTLKEYTFCTDCGKPIEEFLIEKGLVKKDAELA